jgi:hypothetical protein
MSSENNNTSPKKLHNPKAHAPSAYIPAWLLQVPLNLISAPAKLLYGRLSQWSNERGIVYRSTNDLSLELGASSRQIERFIKELKDVGLIGTYHPQAGGVNHFEFYDHPWMHEEINKNLVYKSIPEENYTPRQFVGTPPTDLSVPPDRFVGTPPTDLSDINIKEIKKIKSKNTPTGVDNFKSAFLSLENLTAENPHDIDPSVLHEWLLIRKRKKSPLTRTAWARTNKVLNRLVEAGLNAHECFERMVANGWQGMEFKYFEQELKQPLKKYPTHEERAANELAIRQREIKAQEEKQREIDNSFRTKQAFDALKSSMTFLDAKKKAEGEMKLLGMTAKEYHVHLLHNNRSQCHV